MNTQELYDYLHTNYEYRDGHLYYKVAVSKKIKPGTKAGHENLNWYSGIRICNKHYKLHRIIFLYHNKYLPKLVDHINQIKNDNRIENLREATHTENHLNTKKHSDNNSGYKGVSWNKNHQKWQARICVDKKQIWLGLHPTPELAYEAYCNYCKNNLTIYCLGDNNGSV